MGHHMDGEVVYEKKIPAYWGYAIVGFIFNPLFGAIALLLSNMDGEVVYEKKIPAYWGYAIVGFIFNPLFGAIALLLSRESQRCYKRGWKHARRYSDVSFGFSIIGIVGSILTILMVYSAGFFPVHTYFVRDEVIQGS